MRGLDALGIAYVPSHGNFLLVRVGDARGASTTRLLRKGVIVRPVANYGSARSTCGSRSGCPRTRTAGSWRRCGRGWNRRAGRRAGRQLTAMRSATLAKLVVVGVGLIGGSFALALKRAGAVGERRRRRSRQRNLDDRAAPRHCRPRLDTRRALDRELADADLVLVATPVGQMPALFAAMAPQLGPHTVVTDAGSTKQDVIAAARRRFGAACRASCRAHPIAGTEHSGAAAASASLFRGRVVDAHPGCRRPTPARSRTVAACWTALRRGGARRSMPRVTTRSSRR